MSDTNTVPNSPAVAGCRAEPCSAYPRIEAIKAARKFSLLANQPHMQAESIADHYSKLASVAMCLREMVDIRRRTGGSPAIDRRIDRLANEFVSHHREDFGLELSWQIASPKSTLTK